jgi:hypothetical protein
VNAKPGHAGGKMSLESSLCGPSVTDVGDSWWPSIGDPALCLVSLPVLNALYVTGLILAVLVTLANIVLWARIAVSSRSTLLDWAQVVINMCYAASAVIVSVYKLVLPHEDGLLGRNQTVGGWLMLFYATFFAAFFTFLERFVRNQKRSVVIGEAERARPVVSYALSVVSVLAFGLSFSGSAFCHESGIDYFAQVSAVCVSVCCLAIGVFTVPAITSGTLKQLDAIGLSPLGGNNAEISATARASARKVRAVRGFVMQCCVCVPVQLLPLGFVTALKLLRAYLPALALVQQSVIVLMIINSVSTSRRRRVHVSNAPSASASSGAGLLVSVWKHGLMRKDQSESSATRNDQSSAMNVAT